MAKAKMARGDEGSAVIEFVFLSLLLMVPVVYLVLALAQVQAAAFAAEAVSRDMSRAAVVHGVDALQDGATYSEAESEAREGANAALATTLADFHIEPPDAVVTLDCTATQCFTPGSDVVVGVDIRVGLPGIGALLPAASITVSSSGSSPVDGYRP